MDKIIPIIVVYYYYTIYYYYSPHYKEVIVVLLATITSRTVPTQPTTAYSRRDKFVRTYSTP